MDCIRPEGAARVLDEGTADRRRRRAHSPGTKERGENEGEGAQAGAACEEGQINAFYGLARKDRSHVSYCR